MIIFGVNNSRIRWTTFRNRRSIRNRCSRIRNSL